MNFLPSSWLMISSSCLRFLLGHLCEDWMQQWEVRPHTWLPISSSVTQPQCWHERKQGVKTILIVILSRLWSRTSHLLPGAAHYGASRVGKRALCFGRERKDGIKVSSPSHHGGRIQAHSIPVRSSWTSALNARDILGRDWGRRPVATIKSLRWPLPKGTKTQMNLEKAWVEENMVQKLGTEA